MNKDFFKHKAKSYEQESQRVNNVENIASFMISNIKFTTDMKIMDFGSGTGLLLEKIAPLVGSICAIDISTSMNEQLNKKRAALGCELEIIEMDLTKSTLDRKFDGIISSMTLHHVDDLTALFKQFKAMLNRGGFIALADLASEDGRFHTEDTGVFHYGFEPSELEALASQAGFSQIKINSVSTVHKPHGDYRVLALFASA